MNLPDLAVINFSRVPDSDVLQAIRAVNRQVLEDFAPIWGAAYTSRLCSTRFDPDVPPDTFKEDPVAAEAVIYIVDRPHLANTLGFHAVNNFEVPVGFVFTDPGDWTVTLSHETLELIIDPTENVLVPGPHPTEPENTVLHAYEVCDAVESTAYELDGVRVSNFVTPQYFREGDARGTRNDFLGVGVRSFGVTPGSHVGFFNPACGKWEVFFEPLAAVAAVGAPSALRPAFRGLGPSDAHAVECRRAFAAYNAAPPANARSLASKLGGVLRRDRYERLAERYRDLFAGR